MSGFDQYQVLVQIAVSEVSTAPLIDRMWIEWSHRLKIS